MMSFKKIAGILLVFAAFAGCENSPYHSAAVMDRSEPVPKASPPAVPAKSPPAAISMYGAIDVAYNKRSPQPAPKPQPTTREVYQKLPPNQPKRAATEPVSTFSIDVDTGSYSNTRRFLNEGRLPPPDAVRIEEFVNYFPYDYPQATGKHPFAVATELMPTPWNAESYLLRISLSAEQADMRELPAANLVFLVDTSGSMGSENRIGLVKKTLTIVTNQMRAKDRISIVSYSGTSRVDLESTPGNQKEKILAVIDGLNAAGSTAGGSGIQSAYEQARKNFIPNGINRIILATDGDFNVGITNFDDLVKMIVDQRKSGIFLTTLGFGVNNFNEQLMEQAANKGNGNYAYIDSILEAQKVMQTELTASLQTIAKDVKLQVEFNPAVVMEYRLLGFTNRLLNETDFKNDAVDAGELGAGQRVTAIYEIVPVGKKAWLEPLRYSKKAAGSGDTSEIARVSVRYKQPSSNSSIPFEHIVSNQLQELNPPSQDFQFAAAVAAFAQILQGDGFVKNFSLEDVKALAQKGKGADEMGLRAEFIRLVGLASLANNLKR